MTDPIPPGADPVWQPWQYTFDEIVGACGDPKNHYAVDRGFMRQCPLCGKAVWTTPYIDFNKSEIGMPGHPMGHWPPFPTTQY